VNSWLAGIILLFIGLLSGYATGRRQGHCEGVAEGLALGPLDMRREALLKGYCTLCGDGRDAAAAAETNGDYAGPARTEYRFDGVDTKETSPVTLHFAKMHGLGNNYIYVDLVTQQADCDWPAFARKVSDANFGIGADGLILILPGEDGADFRMRMFNADGSEAQMCGNGIRCVGKYVYDHGLTDKTRLLIDTLAGRLELLLHTEAGRVATVRVDMGYPRLRRADIPILGGDPDAEWREEALEIGGVSYRFTAVSMGNPHVVAFVDNVADFPVQEVGPLVEHHPAFPERTNVEFARIVNPHHIEMRVWERGSGETYACGTGACATAVAAALLGKAERRSQVHLLGGVLEIEWAENGRVYMTGPAEEVATGQFAKAWLQTLQEA
jgi:diaminopimelate epimerase